jgi:endogenous inhibitor of DNA gyrase (YacG/DUF329 family)
MSNRDQQTKTRRECSLCLEPITSDWDTSGSSNSRLFCSEKCLLEDWLEWADVPSTYWTFDPTLPSCGPDRIRLAEDWINAHLEYKGGRPGLLLHSVRSGTGKTRVATHVANLRMRLRWKGHEVVNDGIAEEDIPLPVVWLNARRFRQKYLQTLHFSKAAEREAWVDGLCRCAFLLFDEPDKLKPSEGVMEVIYSILDERFANGNLTVLTTNAAGAELQTKWGPQYGPYLVRRIREFCMAIDFDP